MSTFGITKFTSLGTFAFALNNQLKITIPEITTIREFTFRQSNDLWEMMKNDKTDMMLVSIVIASTIILALVYHETLLLKTLIQKKVSVKHAFPKNQNGEESCEVEITGNVSEFRINHRLNKRQREVLQLLLQGLTNKEIGERLFISPNTVKYHIRNIYRSFNVTSRPELFAKISGIRNSKMIKGSERNMMLSH